MVASTAKSAAATTHNTEHALHFIFGLASLLWRCPIEKITIKKQIIKRNSGQVYRIVDTNMKSRLTHLLPVFLPDTRTRLRRGSD